MTSSFQPAPYNPDGGYHSQQQHYADGDDDDEDEEEPSPDVEMANSEDPVLSPSFTTRPSSSTTTTYSHHQPSVSPALAAQNGASIQRQGSYASINTDHHRHYSFSSTTSPVWGAVGAGGYAVPSNPGSTLTSPALGPLRERDLDQEATAALLMLNSDRRGTVARAGGSGAGRGMSVRDLLSA